MAESVYDRLAQRLLGVSAQKTREVSPPVSRGIVLRSDPLTVEIDDDIVIEEGDEDVEFDRGLLSDRPEEGSTVRVHHDGQDWIVSGVIV